MELAGFLKRFWLNIAICLTVAAFLALWVAFLFVPGFLKPDRTGKLVDIYILPKVDLFVIEMEIDGQNEKFGVESVANAKVMARNDDSSEVIVLLQDRIYGFGDLYRRVTILAPPLYEPVLREWIQKAWQGKLEDSSQKEDPAGGFVPREYY